MAEQRMTQARRNVEKPARDAEQLAALRRQELRVQLAQSEQLLRERKERGEGDTPESRKLLDRVRELQEALRATEDMRTPQERPAATPGEPWSPEGPARRTEVRVYHLQQIAPERVRDALQPVVGRSGQIAVDERTNSVIVHTTPENHARAEEVVRQLDAPAGHRNLDAEVEDLHVQMKQMRDQMQQMQKLLEQAVERGQMEKPAPK